MILVIGGFGQGQAEYAARLWPERRVLPDLQELLRQEEDGTAAAERLLAEDGERVILCDEIGCGVVPLSADERRWREETGRCLMRLAAAAEEVHRVCCGLGMRLK